MPKRMGKRPGKATPGKEKLPTRPAPKLKKPRPPAHPPIPTPLTPRLKPRLKPRLRPRIKPKKEG